MTLDSYAVAALLIAASSVVAVLGLLAVRKTYNIGELAKAHSVSGQYLSIVGTLYAVLLGLIVVDAMSRFQQAITIVEGEGNALSELIYYAGRMPVGPRAKVHELIISYARLVSEQEWPMMSQGEQLPEAERSAMDLMRVIRDWEPASESEKATYAAALPAASDFWNARRLRIIAAQRGIPALEWCAVILGGIVTVGLTYLFVFDDLRIQVTLTAMVALLIALNVFLILMFGYPFSGDVSVSPESFRVVLSTLTLGEPIGA
jgi:hypothetical protein